MNTIKKPVVGYEGLYEVDELGNIYSIKRFGCKGGLIGFSPDRFGYLRVGLCKNNNVKTYKSHRIVAQAFIPNPENKPQVNHINGIKTDNRVENLEWVTSRDNIKHAWSIGKCTAKYGENNLSSKISDMQRIEIIKVYAYGELSQDEICKLYGISQSNVSHIVKSFLKRIISGEALDKTKL